MSLRLALIGCGDIGTLRARAVGRTPGLSLAAVADAESARAHRLATAHGGELDHIRAYTGCLASDHSRP